MNDPNPKPVAPLVPSASTTASGLGATGAALLIYILGQKGITFPAGGEALLAGFITTLAGYLPRAGRATNG